MVSPAAGLAMVFPGQGSQTIGMMGSYAEMKCVRETFGLASDLLGRDLWKLACEGPLEDLNSTVNTQPLMLTAGYATYLAWREGGGPPPALVAGHSLGEYSALVVSEALSFADAVPLVRFRAEAMQAAVPPNVGAMAAILGLSDDDVRAACSEAGQGEVVEAVNFNAPSQVVIAGHAGAVERAAAAAKAKGAKRAIMLPVSAPFHSTLLRPAALKLEEYLRNIKFSAPRIPVINNVDVEVVHDPEKIKDALARQAFRPVRWVELLREMASCGITHVAECGPGKILAGLTRRIDRSLQSIALADSSSLKLALHAFGTGP